MFPVDDQKSPTSAAAAIEDARRTLETVRWPCLPRTKPVDCFSSRLMVAMQEFRMRMLVVEFGEIAVDGFGVAAFCFQLDGQMFDLEFTGHPVPDRLKEVGR